MGWVDGHVGLSPSHLLVLLQKRSWGGGKFCCAVKGNNTFGLLSADFCARLRLKFAENGGGVVSGV